MTVFLHGLRLKNYRGIGNDFVEFAPLKKMNFLIGKNNSGKSIFLDFVDLYIGGGDSVFRHSALRNLNSVDTEIHKLDPVNKIEIQFCSPFDIFEDASSKWLKRYLNEGIDYDNFLGVLHKTQNVQGYYWRSLKLESGWYLEVPRDEDVSEILEIMDEDAWERFALQQTSTGHGADKSANAKSIITNLTPHNTWVNRKTSKVSSIRRGLHQDKLEIERELPEFSNEYLVNLIHALSNANYNELELKQKYEKLNRSLESVLGLGKANVKTSKGGIAIIFGFGKNELPLSKVGKGIEDVLSVLTASVCYDGQIICIEEPELNLHPLIQRRLIKYLSEHTDNQYIISTHSPTIIDSAEGSVFEVTHDGIQTRLRYVELDAEKRAICDDLGYKASDILQSNCVIWVEGPSDKILINHWISLFDADLVEGIHYSIMFYGGGLLSHLTAEWDKALSDFIELRRINANTAIIMDSDKKSETASVNETKKRIEDELSKEKNSYCWITAGREIENYMEFQTFIEIASEVHPKTNVNHEMSGDFDDWYGNKDLDKVKIARKYAETNSSLARLDLKDKIEELVQFIKKSNLME